MTTLPSDAVAKAPIAEIGYQVSSVAGWQQWMDQNEFTPELQWPMSVQVFDQMRRTDGQVKSVLNAVTLPVLRTPWRIDPNGAREEVVQLIADDLGLPIVGRPVPNQPVRQKDRFDWVEHLRLALIMLPIGHCVDQETEALTQRGWLRQHELREGDMLLTLNPDTGLSEWQPCERIHRYEGTHAVRRLDGRSHSSVTTLNHRWITRAHDSKKLRFRTSAELNTNDRILRAAPSADLPTEPKWSDAFVELVAWYWTEGHEVRGGGAALWQSETVNAPKCQRIRAALTALFGPARKSLLHGQGPAFGGWREETRTGGVSAGQVTYWYLDKVAAAELRAIAPRKIVSPAFIASLTSAQLRLFVETSIDADGSRTAGTYRNSVVLAQKDPARLDAFEMACTLLGIPWTRTPKANCGFATGLGKQAEIRPIHTARRADNERTTDELDFVHDGVWCPQVANRTWFARRRGTSYFTGNSYFEQVYRVEDDGSRAHLRKLAYRPPTTIDQINVAPDGGLISIKQRWSQTNSSPQAIPVDRLVAYIFDREGGNWIGTSILRPVYKNWLLKDRLLRVWAQTIERNGMGVPKYKGQDGASETDLAAGKALATSFRAGETAGVAVPFGADLELMGVRGTLPDAKPAVEYHDQQIARAVLAHFLNLGQQTGSWALGSTFADFFTLSLQTLAQQIANVATQHVIEDLVDVNWGPQEPAPKLVFDEIGSRQPATAEAMKTLVDAGILHPDEVLEGAARQYYGLPPADPATSFANEAAPDEALPAGADTATPPADQPFGAESVAASEGVDLNDEASWIAAATGVDTHPGGERLKRMWVYGQLASKWVTWTDLYDHLKRYIKNRSLLKKTVSAWYRLRYGHNPPRHHVAASAESASTEALAAFAEEFPEPPDDEADEWEMGIDALSTALDELSGAVAASFNPSLHPRNPKGGPGGGRFRSTVDRLKDALTEHRSGGSKGDPFEGFDREQLRRAAVKQGITLSRGESRDSISKKLLDHISPKSNGRADKMAERQSKAGQKAAGVGVRPETPAKKARLERIEKQTNDALDERDRRIAEEDRSKRIDALRARIALLSEQAAPIADETARRLESKKVFSEREDLAYYARLDELERLGKLGDADSRELLAALIERDGAPWGGDPDADSTRWLSGEGRGVAVDRPGTDTAKLRKARDRYVKADRNTIIQNASLRSGEPTPAAKSWASQMRSMVRSASLTEDTKLHRGAALSPEQVATLKPGSVLHDAGIVSTDVDPSTAEFYADTRRERVPGTIKTMFEIRAPKGTPAVDVGYGEVVLDHGNKFRIIASSVDDAGVVHVVMELITP